MPFAAWLMLPSLLAGGAASTPLVVRHCATLLADLRVTVDHATSAARDDADRRARRQQRIDTEIAVVAWLADAGAATPCDDSGEAYLSTGNVLLDGESGATLEIIGNAGAHTISFTSGTAMEEVITAINGVRVETGVSAARSVINPDRIELRSMEDGADQFVTVRQIDPPKPPFVFATPTGGEGVRDLTDHGVDGRPGDVDCDDRVGMSDLLDIMRVWGECAACPQDLDGNGVVDGADIAIVLREWGE